MLNSIIKFLAYTVGVGGLTAFFGFIIYCMFAVFFVRDLGVILIGMMGWVTAVISSLLYIMLDNSDKIRSKL